MTTNWDNRSISLLFDSYDDRVENLLGYQPLIAEMKRSMNGSTKILDYGCGGGKVSRRLLEAGFDEITGVDISETMIEIARERTSSEKVEYLKIKNNKVPFSDDIFDAAVCCYVFVNTPTPSEISAISNELFRIIKPGGFLYLLDTNPRSIGIQFSTFLNGSPGLTYENGDQREVILHIPNQEVFRIIDTHWTLDAYLSTLSLAGFADFHISERRARDISADHRIQLGPAEHSYAPFIQLTAKKPLT
ncbi:class I SAM-dependent methyltransferase [Variovorax saccharolyticus]|uniref:class I SAM-dependent methyltransferase n=1 Tax=Variovorax saccharolyticus TaxID=3053516 RepID=UPI002577F598|nr:class I SAM-dependent methyltransferase [Variovorax sp. J31P216]MDM0027079.1 class I SAM-dependent methyltransferase [Variovorax sp. J31P216]